ncbi:secondary thiamine-phosphate synthase enzyme [Dethiosulfatibacter aminovorans DSM 17477]|uniref:Secondary thiamine-phosphate synthase enzyme n=1 Tax=Dethiosulfatibacter aminovorans DSM 17477 TaxID=1121476 RepID=A0A1M6JUS7_9FIRM|nr:secondary thiamine-phosphate synthase enzyme YjbQ [Dethiosulfatibacter aminovorans]SHJ50448.1 secondary thiamine-phosphate synthase enzyme [Dethiosulfatibacter aminovorans DSM 17477]
MVKRFSIRTKGRDSLVDITDKVKEAVRESGVDDGVCIVFIPHTTAGVTINENADPDVTRDIIVELDKIVPHDDGYMHREGNSAAHIKSSMMGSGQTIIVEGGRLVLGTWQGIYFCEFDGPRTRNVVVKIQSD